MTYTTQPAVPLSCRCVAAIACLHRHTVVVQGSTGCQCCRLKQPPQASLGSPAGSRVSVEHPGSLTGSPSSSQTTESPSLEVGHALSPTAHLPFAVDPAEPVLKSGLHTGTPAAAWNCRPGHRRGGHRLNQQPPGRAPCTHRQARSSKRSLQRRSGDSSAAGVHFGTAHARHTPPTS